MAGKGLVSLELVVDVDVPLYDEAWQAGKDGHRESQECQEFFTKSIQIVSEKELTNIDLAAIFKKLGKMLLAFQNLIDHNITRQIQMIVSFGIKATFDEDIRAMLPFCFKGLCKVFDGKSITEFYDQLKEFFKKQIEIGTPKEKKEDEKNKMDPIFLFMDNFGKDKPKHYRDQFED